MQLSKVFLTPKTLTPINFSSFLIKTKSVYTRKYDHDKPSYGNQCFNSRIKFQENFLYTSV